jgi:hypothetical protein
MNCVYCRSSSLSRVCGVLKPVPSVPSAHQRFLRCGRCRGNGQSVACHYLPQRNVSETPSVTGGSKDSLGAAGAPSGSDQVERLLDGRGSAAPELGTGAETVHTGTGLGRDLIEQGRLALGGGRSPER